MPTKTVSQLVLLPSLGREDGRFTFICLHGAPILGIIYYGEINMQVPGIRFADICHQPAQPFDRTEVGVTNKSAGTTMYLQAKLSRAHTMIGISNFFIPIFLSPFHKPATQ